MDSNFDYTTIQENIKAVEKKLVDEAFWKVCRKKLRSNLREGRSRKDTLSTVLNSLLEDKICTDQVFQLIDQGHKFDSPLISKLFAILSEEFKCLESTIAVWPARDYNAFILLNHRYALATSYSSIYVLILGHALLPPGPSTKNKR
jgi:hypothetical protein